MRLREPCQTYSCSLLTPCHFPGPPPFLLKQPLWGAANHHKLAWHSISTTHGSSSNIIGNHEVIAAGYHYDEYWSKKMDRSKQCLWNRGTARIWCSKTPSHNFFGLRRSKWDWIMRVSTSIKMILGQQQWFHHPLSTDAPHAISQGRL